jgi:hypothetical protein
MLQLSREKRSVDYLLV